MRALLIGGNGFIGSHLAERLRDAGLAVRVLDPRAQRADVDWRGIDYLRAPCFDLQALDAALGDCDTVVHLASSTVPATANADPAHDVRSNLLGTLALVDAMRRRGLRRIVFVSSGGTVYGNPERLPADETHPLHPICSYGIVKAALEQYLQMYRQLGDLDPLILRPSNPYGPRQPVAGSQGFVATVMACLRDGRPLRIWGDGGNVRDYLYIDDLVELLARAVRSDICGVFNAGSGIGRSLDEVRGMIERVAGRSAAIESLPTRPYDVRAVVLDIAAARARFGWSPTIGMEEGLARTWRWLQSGDGREDRGASTQDGDAAGGAGTTPRGRQEDGNVNGNSGCGPADT